MMHLVRTDRGLWQRHQNQLQPRLCDLLSDNRNTNSKRDNHCIDNCSIFVFVSHFKILLRLRFKKNSVRMTARPLQHDQRWATLS